MAEWILTSSLLIVIVLAVRALFRGRMGLRLRYALWLLVLLRLLVPGTVFQTGLSVLNYVPLSQTGCGTSPAVPVRRESLRPGGGAHARPAGGGGGTPALRPGGRAGLRARRGGGLEGRSDRGVAGRRGGAGRRPAGVQPALLSAPAADAAGPPHPGDSRAGLCGPRAALPLPVWLSPARGLSDPGGGRRTGAAGPRPAP